MCDFLEIQALALKKLGTSKAGGKIGDNPATKDRAGITGRDLEKFGSKEGAKMWSLQAGDHALKNFYFHLTRAANVLLGEDNVTNNSESRP